MEIVTRNIQRIREAWAGMDRIAQDAVFLIAAVVVIIGFALHKLLFREGE